MSKSPHLSCVWSEPHNWDLLTANTVPHEPGYYAFTDHAGPLHPTPPGTSVLYVGIATRSLRDRIKKYKTGDATGLKGMHRGGLMLLLSRADAAHFHDGRLTHSVQKTPVEYHIKGTTQHGILQPKLIYLRWAVDYRAAIEALLIQQLNPRFNTMLTQD